MKTRQFRQLAGLSSERRAELIAEGLHRIAENVTRLANELKRCDAAGAHRAADLIYNVGREEAGKFLVLIDAFRAPNADQKTISDHFARAGDHLCKLIYAQIADYSIASQSELLGVVEDERRSHYLDGPNDHDWIFRNRLTLERESSLYVDLVEVEHGLQWWSPHDIEMMQCVPPSMELVEAIATTGLVSPEGLQTLSTAWAGFDAHAESNCSEWIKRTEKALHAFPAENLENGKLTGTAWLVADRWPMPMVELDLRLEEVDLGELARRRSSLLQRDMTREYGHD